MLPLNTRLYNRFSLNKTFFIFFVQFPMIKRIPILIFLLIIFYSYFKEDSFNSKTIKIGASLPQTGIIKSWGNSVNSGANAYFKFANDTNLLKDKKINFISYDDKYEPELTQENINELVFKDKVFALFGFVGTPTVKNVLPTLYDEEIPFFAPFTGASFLRDENKNTFINLRSSYEEEIEEIISYLTKVKNIDKIAVFYQNDDFGEEGYISILKSLKKRNLSLVAEGSYKRNTLSITHAFNEIKDASPQAIIMVGAYKANALFVKKAKEDENLKDILFSSISFGDADEMVKKLKNLNTTSDNIIFSQIVPNYKNIRLPIIQEYQALMKKYYPNEQLGFISLEAFLSAKVLVNAISRIKGDITRKKLIYALQTTPPYLLDGLKLEYKNSQLLNEIYLFKYENNEFKELNNEK